MLVVSALCVGAWGGDIEGKVSGMNGKSVVDLDSIGGKTFSAPKDHPIMDQRGLMLSPHLLVIEQGTTVDFLNSDTVQHNAFGRRSMVTRKRGTILEPGPKVKDVPSRFLSLE